MTPRIALWVFACLLPFSFTGISAQSAELKVFASRAVWTVLNEIGPEFEKSSGHKLNLITGLSTDFARRISSGEPFDLIAAPPASLNGLIQSGKLVAASKTDLVRSGYGVAVRKGAPKPDVSSVDKFKAALQNAKSVTYLPVPGVPQIIERLGLKDQLAAKTTIPDSDISSELVAEGKVEIGIIAITQTYTTPGLELAGPLPSEIQTYTTFAAAISSATSSLHAARELLAFLKEPEARRVVRAQGMDPL
jgi:molybdate transport system substrate-binding protein